MGYVISLASKCELFTIGCLGGCKSSIWLGSGAYSAQMLIKTGPFGVKLGYVPKGPLGKMDGQFLNEILRIAREKGCFTLTMEQDSWEGSQEEIPTGFTTEPGRNIQPQRTILVSLTGSEEDWLSRMKQTTRYNIRLAEKKDVKVTETDDIELFFDLMLTTGARDGFGIHTCAYYQKVYDCFHPQGECVVLVATFEERPLGAILALAIGKRAWYVYGASNDQERNRMPTYLLQWEAMRWAASKGCETYDLWGIPDEDEEDLETQFETRSDGLWGVYRFKRGFGGEVQRSVQAVDFVINPMLYRIYRKLPGKISG
jgi:peptidoglycan pentaglycine glycine transferase (the first glycine)